MLFPTRYALFLHPKQLQVSTEGQIQFGQSQSEPGEGLPANCKLAQASMLLLLENSSLFLTTTGPSCSPSRCGARAVLQGLKFGVCLLVVCSQLTSQLLLAHLPLLLQAFKVLHPRNLEDQV